MKDYIPNLVSQKRTMSTVDILSTIMRSLFIAGLLVWAVWGISSKLWGWLSGLLLL